MGKYVNEIQANKDEFKQLVELIEMRIGGSVSSSSEEKTIFENGNVDCAVMAFERYSATGGNRVSLNVTLVGDGETIKIVGYATGGSQAMFFKINTFGEDSFLSKLMTTVREFNQTLERKRKINEK